MYNHQSEPRSSRGDMDYRQSREDDYYNDDPPRTSRNFQSDRRSDLHFIDDGAYHHTRPSHQDTLSPPSSSSTSSPSTRGIQIRPGSSSGSMRSFNNDYNNSSYSTKPSLARSKTFSASSSSTNSPASDPYFNSRTLPTHFSQEISNAQLADLPPLPPTRPGSMMSTRSGLSLRSTRSTASHAQGLGFNSAPLRRPSPAPERSPSFHDHCDSYQSDHYSASRASTSSTSHYRSRNDFDEEQRPIRSALSTRQRSTSYYNNHHHDRPSSVMSAESFGAESFHSCPAIVLDRMHSRGFTDVTSPSSPSSTRGRSELHVPLHSSKASIDSGYGGSHGSCTSGGCGSESQSIAGNSPLTNDSRQDTQQATGGWSNTLRKAVGWEEERSAESEIIAAYEDVPLPPLPRAPPSSQGSGLWNKLTSNLKVFSSSSSEDERNDEDFVVDQDGESKLSRAIKSYHFSRAETAEDLPTWLVEEDRRKHREGHSQQDVTSLRTPAISTSAARANSIRSTSASSVKSYGSTGSSVSKLYDMDAPLPALPTPNAAPISRRSASGYGALQDDSTWGGDAVLSGGRYKSRPEMPSRVSSRSIEKLLAQRAEERLRGIRG